MKKLILVFGALTLCLLASGQSVDLTQILGPNNSFNDPAFGVSLTYPAGWEVLGGARWGKNNGENTFQFRALWPSQTRPSLYYQRFSADNPRPTDFESYFRKLAQSKAASRAKSGGDYQNVPESFVFKTIAGGPSFSYLATFTNGGMKMAEYFVRVVGEKAYVMFITVGSPEEIDAIRPDLDRMVETVRVQ